MNIQEISQYLSAILGIFATIFFGHGVALQKTALMLEISCSYFGPNPSKVKDLADQKADYIVAFTLLSSSFILQLISLLISEDLFKIKIIDNFFLIIYSTIISPLPYFVLKEISKNLSFKYEKQVESLWKQKEQNLRNQGSY